MGWIRRLFSRRLEADLDKELRFHFESQVADKVRSGIPESEAVGSHESSSAGSRQIKEDCRERRGTIWLQSASAGCSLRSSPAGEITWLYADGGADSGPRHRRNHGDLHARAAGDVAISACRQAGSVVAYRRSAHCCDWEDTASDSDGEAGNWSLLVGSIQAIPRKHAGDSRSGSLQAGNMPLVVQRSSSSGPPDTANGSYVSGNFFSGLWAFPAGAVRLFASSADDLEGAPPVAW